MTKANRVLLGAFAALALFVIVNFVWYNLTTTTRRPADEGVLPFFYVAGFVVLAVLAGSVAYWAAVQLRRGSVPRTATETEGLALLTERAGQYLDGLYWVLWVAGGYLLVFGYVLAEFGDTITVSMQDYVRPGSWFPTWTLVLITAFWLATVAVWMVYLVQVHQERRRWKARLHEQPFAF